MLGRILKGIILVALLGIVAYSGVCIYALVQGPQGVHRETNQPTPEEAPYYLTIVNTGATIYTNKILASQVSEEPELYVYTTQGYWEVKEGQFIYRDLEVPLDERIFGKIEIGRR